MREYTIEHLKNIRERFYTCYSDGCERCMYRDQPACTDLLWHDAVMMADAYIKKLEGEMMPVEIGKTLELTLTCDGDGSRTVGGDDAAAAATPHQSQATASPQGEAMRDGEAMSGVRDAVEHPLHYNTGCIEVWDAITDWGLDFLLGNVVKYVARAGKKGDRGEDLLKAREYIEKAIEVNVRKSSDT